MPINEQQQAHKPPDPERGWYDAYLRSAEWAKRRAARLAYDGYRCVDCHHDGSESRLEVHHLTYARVGHERIEDLVTLCNDCHAAAHGRAPLRSPVAGVTNDQLAARARRQDTLRRRAARAAMPLEERVRDIAIRAERGDRAAKRALFVIEQRLTRAQRQIAQREDHGVRAAAAHA